MHESSQVREISVIQFSWGKPLDTLHYDAVMS